MARRQRERFGAIRQLPLGRWQAHYVHNGTKVQAPHTFLTKTDARGWLRQHESQILGGIIPTELAPTFADYSAAWLAGRDLRARTRADYQRILDRLLLPTIGPVRVDTITPADVRRW